MFEIKRDGGWGWVVLLCVLCSQTILGGICVSSGMFYMIFMDTFNSDPVEISWLCSLPTTLWYLSSPLGSFLTNRYGCRACAVIGGALATIGLCLGFFATSIGYLFFSHGFLTGVGFGLNYTASMTVLNKYFDKFKTTATGLASVGHNAGLIIYAKLIIYLQETYGWRGMLLVNGALAFNLCACALAMFPLKIEDSPNTENIYNTCEKVKTSSKKRKSIHLSVFRKLSFISFCVSSVFTNGGCGIYMLQLPSYSTDAGFTQDNVGTVLIVFGITTVVGKLIYSFVGQHPRVDVTALYSISLTAAGIFICLTPLFLTRAGMLILTGLVGFFSCVTGALLQAVIYRIVGFQRFADGVGMCLPFKAIGVLIGGPLAGFLFASTGSYASSFYLAGACLVVCSVIMIQPTLHHRRREKMHRNKKNETISEINVDSYEKVLDDSTVCNETGNCKVDDTVEDNIQTLQFGKSLEENERFLKTDAV